MSIEVRPAPVPIAVGDNFFMEGPIGQLQGEVLGNDSDPLGQALTARQVTLPAFGFTSFNPDGFFFYFPNPGFLGLDSSPTRPCPLTDASLLPRRSSSR